MMIICGVNCADCKHASFETNDKGVTIIDCAARNKKYYYGQAVMCEDKNKEKKKK